MATIEIFVAPSCPFCVRAKALLDKKGATYDVIDLSKFPDRRGEMEKRAQRTSVPQIFIDDYHVGGYDDMVELDMDGELDPRLQA